MPIRNRRQGREAALQSLYSMDIGGLSLEETLENLAEYGSITGEVLQFAERLIRGVFEKVDDLDEIIAGHLVDWTIDRVPVLDRNLLRIATYELYHCPEIPPAVTINEAVTIGKKFSTAETGKFANGVLGSIMLASPKAAGKALTAEDSETEDCRTEEEPEVIVEDIEIGSPRFEELAKSVGWTLKTHE